MEALKIQKHEAALMVENGRHRVVVTSGSSMPDAEDQVMSEALCQSYIQSESAHVKHMLVLTQ